MFHQEKELQNLKIMLLQLRKRRSLFLTIVRGDLVQKRTRGANQIAEQVKQQLARETEKTNWIYAPRAKVAVSMSFHAKGSKIPDLHNLVKFYLDPLRSVIFTDDRQVNYLVARCWSPSESSHSPDDRDGRVFVKVERLTDYKQKFDLYFDLIKLAEFRRFLEQDYCYQHLIPKDYDPFDGDEKSHGISHYGVHRSFEKIAGLLDSLLTADSPWLSSETREKFHQLREKMRQDEDNLDQNRAKFLRFEMEEYQRQDISLNNIDQLDRPGGLKPKCFRKQSERRNISYLFTVELGGLPARGKSKQYKQRIRTRFEEFRQVIGPPGRILIPIELDVQVTPHGTRLGKDLDNIMRDIIPAFRDELLDSKAYIHSYRIYVTDKFSEDDYPGGIRLKLLPLGAIGNFESTMEETFAAAESWLSSQF